MRSGNLVDLLLEVKMMNEALEIQEKIVKEEKMNEKERLLLAQILVFDDADETPVKEELNVSFNKALRLKNLKLSNSRTFLSKLRNIFRRKNWNDH